MNKLHLFDQPQPDHQCLVGLQWGDEGKGKIADRLSLDVDAVVRYQGGANAGHTIFIEGEKHVLHHLPSGVLQPNVLAILANGMVIEPREFMQEYNLLPDYAKANVRVSDRAHLVLPEHLQKDAEREQDKDGTKIGTTLRGIGPTYESKYARFGVRVGDLADREDLLQLEHFKQFFEAVEDKIVDTVVLLEQLHKDDQKILFESAQGVLLDVDFGQYPFVTSSHCTFLGMGPGTGFSPRRIKKVIGVAKCYNTKVGTGPFPSLADPEGDQWLRDRGSEYGATTGRPRACGWLDIPALKYALQISDVDEIAMTKMDILNGLKEVPVCVGYEVDGQLLTDFPSDTETLNRVEPVIEKWPGWNDASDYNQVLPFLQKVMEATKTPVVMIGFGPNRSDILSIIDHPSCAGPCCESDLYSSGLKGSSL